MPVTAKLSRKFYETLGDEIANELVEWFNQVDATYRADLRELNELNFARFDATLGQRMAQLDAKIDRRAADLEAKIDQRTAELEAKIDQRTADLEAKIDQRAAELDAKIDQRTAELDAKIDRRAADLEVKIDQRAAELRNEITLLDERVKTQLAGQRAELTRWMFLFWIGTVVPLGGLIVALMG